ncbi:MAG TPA: GrpB family protein [Ktedonobacterales bacterium]|nr:GrpB family protein [Ktedonobacterales bacterium]
MERTHDDDRAKGLFTQERTRLIEALGMISDGGIVEHIEHVGATSVPGLLGQPSIDIAISAWPFPLEEPERRAIESLGYELDAGFSRPQEQRFLRKDAQLRLYVAEAGSALWADYVLVRDYLRHDEAARQALSARKQEWADNPESPGYHEAKGELLDRLAEDAHQLWIEQEHFGPTLRVAEELRDMPCPWYICGGWALDLFRGQVSRVHLDVDVIVPRADQLVMQKNLTDQGWSLVTSSLDGQRLERWPLYMRLEPPRHQVHALRDGAFIDILLTDLEGAWHYRREPTVIRDLSRIGLQSPEGIWFLAPELVLLFKSANTSGRERNNDQGDFERTYSSLEPERRAWLRWALTAVDPSHPWIEQL